MCRWRSNAPEPSVELDEDALAGAVERGVDHGTLVARRDDREAAAATRIVADPLTLTDVRDAVFELHEHVGAVVEAQAVTRAEVLVDPHPHKCTLSGCRTSPASVQSGVAAALGEQVRVRT